ncbi:LANO_0H19636g1_1 [Lachancea nothofagi CBS 11611]|uniref:LANO_0H19636g1_1 n=1 Tax=Lachancea nothofagi CBS 11611 TaxID=1266666 RepID=A0A1G4KND6_9SACH|nr:LANO_0H19636g1_1 [Lachancea nothofagi CBS 11611]
MDPHIGDRLSVAGQHCTVRYVGLIPQWKDEKAIGVEWDDENRGKHSGIVGGVEYFKTKAPKAGSFVKEAKVARPMKDRKSFVDAISNVYFEEPESFQDVYFGSKRAEMFGLKDLNARNRDILQLERIDLSKRQIYSSGEVSKLNNLKSKLKRLKQLDISYNLFTDMREALSIVRGISSLTSLDISGNKFASFELDREEQAPFIEVVSLNYCNMSATLITKALSLFPNLKILNINGNDLEELCLDSLASPMIELSLSENKLREIPSCISKSNIQNVNLSFNPIFAISHTDYSQTTNLDISYCEFSTWDIVDDLCIWFPNLKSLRINNNPLTSNEKGNDAYLQLVGRIRQLEYLDGTFIAEKTRGDSELYFMSRVSKGLARIDEKGQQWKYLIEKHGQIVRKADTEDIALGLQVLRLKIFFESKEVQIVHALPCYSVRYLKTVISNLISLPILDFKLNYVSLNGVIQEFNFEFSPISMYNLNNDGRICVIKTTG